MRFQILILPGLVWLAACAKTNDKLRIAHDFKHEEQSSDQKTFEAATSSSNCLNIPEVIHYFDGQSQGVLTEYVRGIRVAKRDLMGSKIDELTSLAADVKTSGDIAFADKSIALIRSFPANTLSSSKIVQPFLPAKFSQDDCVSARIGDEDFAIVESKAGGTKSVVTKGTGAAANTNTVAQQALPSPSRFKLILKNDEHVIRYEEAGGVLTISEWKALGDLKTCADKTPQPLVQIKTVVLVHGRAFSGANINVDFARLLKQALPEKSFPAPLAKRLGTDKEASMTDVRQKDSVQQEGKVLVQYDEMEALQTAIDSGLLRSLQCK